MVLAVATIGGVLVGILLPEHMHADKDSISTMEATSLAPAKARDVAAAVAQGGDETALAKAAVPANLPKGVRVQVVAKDGRIWVDTQGAAGRTVTTPELTAWFRGTLSPSNGQVRVAQPIEVNGELWGFYGLSFFSSAVPNTHLNNGSEGTQRLNLIFLGSVGLALVMNVALFWAFGWHIVKPIRQLSAVVSRIATGDLSARTQLGKRRDELGQFARDLDLMASRLEEARDQAAAADKARRYLVAAASHDLRTPLTALLAHAEAVRTGVSDDPDRSLSVIEEKGLLLKQLIDDLFELAALDAQQDRWQTVRTDAAELVRQSVVGVLPELEAAGIDVEADIPEEALWANLAPGKFERVMDNLLTNARKYGADGRWIGVRVASIDSRIRVEVANRGPAIPEEQAPQIFDRFYRSDSARTSSAGGSGLGLAIASELVARHGGVIGVESPPGGGVTFWFELPALDATAVLRRGTEDVERDSASASSVHAGTHLGCGRRDADRSL